MGALSVVTAATEGPVTRDQAKVHCRVDTGADDTYIDALIAAATTYAERFTRRTLVSQTLELRLDSWPHVIELPPPVTSVASVKYVDLDGVEQTLSASLYDVDTYSSPARVVPAYGETWPTARATNNAIVVQFVAGYASGSAVPAEIRQAVLLMVAHWYENREPAVTGSVVNKIPWSAETLLRGWQVPEIR